MRADFQAGILVENASIWAFGLRESMITTLARIMAIFNEIGTVSAGF